MCGLSRNILGPNLGGQSNGNGAPAKDPSKEYVFTAGANQTQFNLSAAPHNLNAAPDNVSVYLNETKLVGVNKYALAGFTITLAEAPFTGTVVTIRTHY